MLVCNTVKRVLFVGDINIDVIMGGLASPPVLDKEITCATYDVLVGGSTCITACAYASLGGAASIAGLVGQDGEGQFLLRELKAFGVKTNLVRNTQKVKTGVTVNLIIGSTRSQVTYPGTIAEFDAADIHAGVLEGCRHLHISGPYLQTKLRPKVSRLLKLARRLGMTASLDPQWDATEHWKDMKEWMPLLTYLFLNEGEAISVTRTASARAALGVLAGKTRCPVIKMGGKGALIMDGGKVRSIPTPPKKIVDTTGAGDSFNAGFLFATLEKGMPLMDTARFAAATGARSCKFAGGVGARSTYNDVLKMMKGNRSE